MVNAINIVGGVKLNEPQKQKETPDEILETQGASAIEQAITAQEYQERDRFIKAKHSFFKMEPNAECYCDYCDSETFAFWQTDDPDNPEEICYACDNCLKRLNLPYDIEKPKAYHSKCELSVKNWYRRNVGTYPKWFALFTKRIVRFIFKYFTHKKIEFILRGRGRRPAGCRQDLPIRYAKKVAIYITIYKRE